METRLPKDRPGLLAFGVLLSVLLVLRLISIYTENINWDEFALMARAADTLRTGELRGGGRPGLGTLVLLPFVENCRDAVAAVRSARWLWTGFTVAIVVGFWVLLRRLLGGNDRNWQSAALGVGLLILVPAFLRYSLQVRTDQPALVCGVWAAVALLASRRTLGWSAVAGVLFGVGFLFSQKLVYVAALAGLLAAGELFLRNEFNLRREAIRSLLCAVAGIAVLASYESFLARFFVLSPAVSLSGGLNTFAYYREAMGYRHYLRLLPGVLPHVTVGGLLIVVTIAAIRDRNGTRTRDQGRRLILAWMVIGLGLAVGVFHAAAFPYFWMTLGLFPATAGALAFRPIREFFSGRMSRLAIVGGVWGLLVGASIPAAALLLVDTQAVQRQSFSFIDRNFRRTASGFHPERGLFCRDDSDPFPTYFSQNIYWYFHGPDRLRNIDWLIDEFRSRPVHFILGSFRLDGFPAEIKEFWDEHYVRHGETVRIPGRQFNGREGDRQTFEIIVPGTYHWLNPSNERQPSLRVRGRRLTSSDTITLPAGKHSADFLRDVDDGTLILLVNEAPHPNQQPFYKGL